jgi:hypothetical protein
MKKLPIYISLLFVLTCAKEDSQAPNTPPTQIVKQYTLTASAGDGGSVSGGGTFASGTQVSLTATATSGYSFSGWSNGSTANPLTVTLNSNTSITANFQVIINSYTLTVTAGEGGSVSTEGGEYQEGTEVTITATPEEGYGFIGWNGSDSSSSTISVTLAANTTIEAIFRLFPQFTLPEAPSKMFTKGVGDTLSIGFSHAGGYKSTSLSAEYGSVSVISEPNEGDTEGNIIIEYTVNTVENVDWFRTIAGTDNIEINFTGVDDLASISEYQVRTQPEPIYKDYLKTNRETSRSRANKIDPNLIRHLNGRDNLKGCNIPYNPENFNINGNSVDVMRHFVMIDLDLDGYEDLVLHPNYWDIDVVFTSVKMDIEVYFYENGEYVFREVLNQNGQIPEAHLVSKFLVGDFDNDGRPDLYATNSGIDAPPYTNENSFFLYNDYNTNGYLTQIDNTYVNYGHNATSGDIDNDGDLDIFQNGRPGDSNGLYDFIINNGGRSFTKGDFLSDFKIEGRSWKFFQGIYTSELRDINKDGHLDLLLHGHAMDDFEYSSEIQPSWGKILFSNSSGNFNFNNLKYIPSVENFDLGLDFQFYDINNDGNEEIFVLRTGDGSIGNTIDGPDVNVNIGVTNYYSGYYIQILEYTEDDELVDVTSLYMDGNGQSGIPHGCNNLSFFYLEIGDYDNNGLLDLYSLLPQNPYDRFVRWEYNGSKFVKQTQLNNNWLWGN